MPFPAPNDASKLRRSVASTTQQGKITSMPFTGSVLTPSQASSHLDPDLTLRRATITVRVLSL
jgi:hypothetical protein